MQIATEHLPTIRERVAKINRRAEKLGVEGVSLKLGERSFAVRYDERDVKYNVEVIEVEVIGPRVKIDGWEFFAVIDHVEHLVKAMPGAPENLNLRHLVEDDSCEHCNTDRRRNSTFVLSKDTELVKVGSTCLKDFLGHDVNLTVMVKSMELEDEFERMGMGGVASFDLEYFLTVAAGAIREFGWTSRSKAREEMTSSTSEDVLSHMFNSRFKIETTDEDAQLAAATLAWARTLSPDDFNDYLGNLAQIAANNFVTPRSAGLAASMINAYQRAEQIRMEREAQITAPVPEGRITVTGKIVKLAWKEGFQGQSRRVFTVLDDRGFRVWGTVPSAIASKVEPGNRVTFIATLEASDRDETFGFAKRPSKAQLV